MNKAFALFGLSLSLTTLSACGGGHSSCPKGDEPVYTITFDLNYEGAPAASKKTFEQYDLAEPIANPTREGYTFEGWFEEDLCLTPFKWNILLKSDWTVYAGWTSEGEEPIPSSSATGEQSATSEPTPSSSSTAEEPISYIDYYIVGSFTNPTWGGSGTNFDKTYRLQSDAPTNTGKYMGLSLKSGDEFKIVKFAPGDAGISNDGWHGGEGGASGEGWRVSTDGMGAGNIVITANGTYNVYLTNKLAVSLAKA